MMAEYLVVMLAATYLCVCTAYIDSFGEYRAPAFPTDSMFWWVIIVIAGLLGCRQPWRVARDPDYAEGLYRTLEPKRFFRDLGNQGFKMVYCGLLSLTVFGFISYVSWLLHQHGRL
jgi:hypothetical protein